MMTQNQMVLQYMQENGGISSMAAFGMGVTRLAARIHDLRDMGYSIKAENVRYKAKDGKSKTYAKYSLVGEE